MIEFCSTNTKFKTPFGAVTEKTDVSFFVKTSEEVSGVTLVVNDVIANKLSEEPMKKSVGGFVIKRAFLEKGLYFYRFKLSQDEGIYRGEGGKGVVAENGAWFQQTVYSKKYKAPKGYTGGIFYQIFPDRFNIGRGGVLDPHFTDRKIHNDLNDTPDFLPDENGVVRNNDYFGGNLLGIEEKLDYLKSLGVTEIYLNPVCESHATHRYNPADYRKIDPLLGTEKDFKRLCVSARAKGIQIILDGVFSHTGDDSVYFNRYGRYDSVGACQSKTSPYHEWYKYDESRNDYVYWWGFPTLPEVEETTPSFIEFICGVGGVIDYWFSLGIDGVRLDVADELPDMFIAKVREAVKRNKKNAMLLGEVWEDASNKISYGVQRAFLFGDELDSVMNYPFCEAILEFIRTANEKAFVEAVMTVRENYPKVMLDNMMNPISTHDTERAINRLLFGRLENLDKASLFEKKISSDEYLRGAEMVKLAFALMFTLPGIPCIYYGDEVGMTGFKDPFNRGFMKWQGGNENILDCVREIAGARKSFTAFSDGEIEFLLAENGAVAFLRKGKKETALVAVNRGEQTVSINLPNGRTEEVAPWRYLIKKI